MPEVLIVAFVLRLLLYSPKKVSEINQELHLKVGTAKQGTRIVTTRGMRYNNMWDCSTTTVMCYAFVLLDLWVCMHQYHRIHLRINSAPEHGPLLAFHIVQQMAYP